MGDYLYGVKPVPESKRFTPDGKLEDLPLILESASDKEIRSFKRTYVNLMRKVTEENYEWLSGRFDRLRIKDKLLDLALFDRDGKLLNMYATVRGELPDPFAVFHDIMSDEKGNFELHYFLQPPQPQGDKDALIFFEEYNSHLISDNVKLGELYEYGETIDGDKIFFTHTKVSDVNKLGWKRSKKDGHRGKFAKGEYGHWSIVNSLPTECFKNISSVADVVKNMEENGICPVTYLTPLLFTPKTEIKRHPIEKRVVLSPYYLHELISLGRLPLEETDREVYVIRVEGSKHREDPILDFFLAYNEDENIGGAPPLLIYYEQPSLRQIFGSLEKLRRDIKLKRYGAETSIY